MSRGLAALARRAGRSRQALAKRGGGGGPLPTEAPPSRPLAEQEELVWRDGSANPEPALDQFTLVSKWEALGSLAGAFAFFGVLGLAAYRVDLGRPKPFADKAVIVPPEVSQTFAKAS